MMDILGLLGPRADGEDGAIGERSRRQCRERLAAAAAQQDLVDADHEVGDGVDIGRRRARW
jgi:hypothetical protein